MSLLTSMNVTDADLSSHVTKNASFMSPIALYIFIGVGVIIVLFIIFLPSHNKDTPRGGRVDSMDGLQYTDTVCTAQIYNGEAPSVGKCRTHDMRNFLTFKNTSSAPYSANSLGAFEHQVRGVTLQRSFGSEGVCIARFYSEPNFKGCFWETGLPAGQAKLETKTFRGMASMASSMLLGTGPQLDSKVSEVGASVDKCKKVMYTAPKCAGKEGCPAKGVDQIVCEAWGE